MSSQPSNLLRVYDFSKDWEEHLHGPQLKAAQLGRAARSYFDACGIVREKLSRVAMMGAFMLPSMHQTIELASKGICHKVDEKFRPRGYSHWVVRMMSDYQSRADIFAEILSDPEKVAFLKGLECAYLGVRYGEAAIMAAGEDLIWAVYEWMAVRLLHDLSRRTEIPFPPLSAF